MIHIEQYFVLTWNDSLEIYKKVQIHRNASTKKSGFQTLRMRLYMYLKHFETPCWVHFSEIWIQYIGAIYDRQRLRVSTSTPAPLESPHFRETFWLVRCSTSIVSWYVLRILHGSHTEGVVGLWMLGRDANTFLRCIIGCNIELEVELEVWNYPASHLRSWRFLLCRNLVCEARRRF